MVIVGAGYIACEQACIFNNFGTEVHMLYMDDVALQGVHACSPHQTCNTANHMVEEVYNFTYLLFILLFLYICYLYVFIFIYNLFIFISISISISICISMSMSMSVCMLRRLILGC